MSSCRWALARAAVQQYLVDSVSECTFFGHDCHPSFAFSGGCLRIVLHAEFRRSVARTKVLPLFFPHPSGAGSDSFSTPSLPPALLLPLPSSLLILPPHPPSSCPRLILPPHPLLARALIRVPCTCVFLRFRLAQPLP